ncbi:MAG: hypothetical protein HY525_18055 [Betaproteobacteria bacterium]|nr:hypothetical protein [Betaproteobacteria bacterium]
MSPDRQHIRYVLIFVAVVAVLLLPVLTLNYLLGERTFGRSDVALRASRWQQATRGVTYAPPLSDNRAFKSARLFDRLPEIDSVVFGSSTAMGITQDMFPSGMKVYNFAQTGNSLATVIAEAEFLQRTQANLRWLVIPLDWSLGFIYQPGEPGRVELAPPVPGVLEVTVTIGGQLQDAMSLPRVKNLLAILGDLARAPSPPAAFRQMYLQEASDDYRCADGTPAKDFDTIFRGACTGFRYDGSATFANLQPVPARRADALIASAVVPSSKYAVELIKTGGEPNPVVLDRLAALAHDMKRAGGGVVLFLPPLLPGMERALLDSPHTGGALRRTKQIFDAWARDKDLIMIDAGQSERYGCAVEEFVDEHHALPQCYARVFGRFWSDPRAVAKPGLWSGVDYPR